MKTNRVTLIGIRADGKPVKVKTPPKYLTVWKRTFTAMQRDKYILDFDIIKE